MSGVAFSGGAAGEHDDPTGPSMPRRGVRVVLAFRHRAEQAEARTRSSPQWTGQGSRVSAWHPADCPIRRFDGIPIRRERRKRGSTSLTPSNAPSDSSVTPTGPAWPCPLSQAVIPECTGPGGIDRPRPAEIGGQPGASAPAGKRARSHAPISALLPGSPRRSSLPAAERRSGGLAPARARGRPHRCGRGTAARRPGNTPGRRSVPRAASAPSLRAGRRPGPRCRKSPTRSTATNPGSSACRSPGLRSWSGPGGGRTTTRTGGRSGPRTGLPSAGRRRCGRRSRRRWPARCGDRRRPGFRRTGAGPPRTARRVRGPARRSGRSGRTVPFGRPRRTLPSTRTSRAVRRSR